MVRAPCCEKIGLKKGQWTHDEDQILISYIQKHGHSNWRSLPKQAGLLRCGKSCRLRWINYLRPGIKRGNFTNDEEETIIKLHEKLGNRWSAIAAKLPGRTDNEIKNVWYTILKKRLLKPNQPNSNTRKVSKPKIKQSDSNSSTLTQSEQDTNLNFHEMKGTPLCTYSSDFSSVTANDEGKNMDNTISSEDIESLEIMPEIDESFWSEEAINSEETFQEKCGYASNFDDGMDFWYDVFIRAGESNELPEF